MGPQSAAARAKKVTDDHIKRVRELLDMASGMLSVRGFLHDRTKYDEKELGPLSEMQTVIEREGQAPFGSDEYKRRTAMLGPMLGHHYANNSHHPEHYENGVAGMCLIDLVEMFFDWKAASERGEEPMMNLTAAIERFAVSPQLAQVFRNTADRLGYVWS